MQSKLTKLEEDHKRSQLNILKLSDYIDELEAKAVENSLRMEAAYDKVSKLTALNEKSKQNADERIKSRDYVDLLNQEKSSLEKDNKQKDAKIKQLISKIQGLEILLTEQKDTLGLKEQIILNANKQLEILKKRLVTNNSPIRQKQNPSELIEILNKKNDNSESQIKMLKDIVKGLQKDIKMKQSEISRIKNSRFSPIQNHSPPRD